MENSSYFESLEAKAKGKYCEKLSCVGLSIQDDPYLPKNDARFVIALYPGHVGGGKSGLVSTVCACANNSGNFSRTSLVMDKLHMVVMRRNNQTRYTACSVAAVFTRRSLPLSETQAVTRQGLRYNHRQFHHHCACS